MRKDARRVLILLVMAMLVLATGCSIRVADLTALSTRNVNLDKVDLDALPQTRSVEGEDTAWMVLVFPIGFPHLEDAVDEALDKADGDIMVDVVVYSSGWWFIVGQNTIRVKGNVVKTRGVR